MDTSYWFLYKVSSRALSRLKSTDLRYIVSPNMRDFASQGLSPFPDAIFNLFVEELVEDNWGKTGGGSRQLRMLTWFSLIWSLFQFLVIIDYFFFG